MNTLNLQNLSVSEIQTALETYMWEARKQRVEEYKEQDVQTSSVSYSYGSRCAIPKIKIANTKCELSVQGSEGHYCSPRENLQEIYDEVEIGFPNFDFTSQFISRYADDSNSPQDTVYGYVPMQELAQEIYNLLNNKI